MIGGCLFGDEGKGTTVEFMTKQTNSKYIVRWNGGCQAMHHVVIDSQIWHCFAQWGAGSFFPGVNTILSKFMFLSPQTLLNEMDYLVNKGVQNLQNRMFIDLDSVIITPYGQLENRVREILKGKLAYGTTGMGIGVTMNEAYQAYPDDYPHADLYNKFYDQSNSTQVIRTRDLLNEEVLQKKLQEVIEKKMQIVRDLISGKISIFDQKYLAIHGTAGQITAETKQKAMELFMEFINRHTIDSMLEFYGKFTVIFKQNFVDTTKMIDDLLSKGENLVFEGAQGALLDKIHGFYPHLTQSLCSDDNAQFIMKNLKTSFQLTKIGIFRIVSSRHGAGPFLTHKPEWLESTGYFKEDHNPNTVWQGNFRIGPFDMVAAKYGLSIFKPDVLSITCLDKLAYAAEGKPDVSKFEICLSYTLCKENLNEKILSLLENGLVVENQKNENGDYVISKIIKRNHEDAYMSTDLLSILNLSKPNYTDLTTLLQLVKPDEKIQLLVEQQAKKVFKGVSHEIDERLSQFVGCVQTLLQIPIRVLSFGARHQDKILV